MKICYQHVYCLKFKTWTFTNHKKQTRNSFENEYEKSDNEDTPIDPDNKTSLCNSSFCFYTKKTWEGDENSDDEDDY